MSVEMQALKDKAEKGRVLYNTGHIERKEAEAMIMPYINAVNARSKELARKYNQRPRLTNFKAFIR